jgi:hypothetical protein
VLLIISNSITPLGKVDLGFPTQGAKVEQYSVCLPYSFTYEMYFASCDAQQDGNSSKDTFIPSLLV